MAHLGQIDRRFPGQVVFTRYVTENADWKKLKLRIENGQVAEMFQETNNILDSMNVTIQPRTEIKLLSEKYKEFERKKYYFLSIVFDNEDNFLEANSFLIKPFLTALPKAELTELRDFLISSVFLEEIRELKVLTLFFILLNNDLLTSLRFNACLHRFFADL